MSNLSNHFEECSYIEEFGFSMYEAEYPCDGYREYLSGSHSKRARCYSGHHDYNDGGDDNCMSSYEEPDPDELAAFWHEKEVSV